MSRDTPTFNVLNKDRAPGASWVAYILFVGVVLLCLFAYIYFATERVNLEHEIVAIQEENGRLQQQLKALSIDAKRTQDRLSSLDERIQNIEKLPALRRTGGTSQTTRKPLAPAERRP